MDHARLVFGTGSQSVGTAELLDGYDATTHWALQAVLPSVDAGSPEQAGLDRIGARRSFVDRASEGRAPADA